MDKLRLKRQQFGEKTANKIGIINHTAYQIMKNQPIRHPIILRPIIA